LAGIGSDLRGAWRALAARPGHALAIVLTLALALGASTAIYSAVDAVLVRALPYPDADRIVTLWAQRGSEQRLIADYADIEQWRAQSTSFDALAAIRGQSVNLTGAGTPDRLAGEFAEADAFAVLGARAAIGRLYTRAESAPGSGAEVVVLSARAWRERFGGDAAVVGRTLVLNGRPHVIVGVLADGFEDPYNQADVWLPITSLPGAQTFARGGPKLWAVARLAPGRSRAAAQDELDAIAARLAREFPTSNAGIGVAVVPLRDQVAGRIQPALLTLAGAVLAILLIACANIANLQFARASSRRREMALRGALGASRRRMLRQQLLESLLLSAAGGAGGLLVAAAAVNLFGASADDWLPAGGGIAIDAHVIAAAVVLSVLAMLLCGLAPAWFAASAAPDGVLSARGGDVRDARVRRLLLITELALALALGVCTTLLARSIDNLAHSDPGFAPANVLTFQLRLPRVRYAEGAQQAAFFDSALERVRAVPGVRAAAFVGATPFTGNWDQSAYATTSTAPDAKPIAQTNTVSDGYFATMGITLRAGRDFDGRDQTNTQPVAIVSAEFARREWPGQPALGQRLRLAGSADWLNVVGVAANTQQLALSDPPAAQVYRPIRQAPGLFGNVVARTAGDPLAAASAVRAAVWAVDAEQPVWSIHSLDELLARSTATLRLTTKLAAAFACSGLLLALLGVYAVMSFVVVQRTREVGIRIAVGARRAGVLALIVGDALRLTAVAVVVGWLVAAAAARLLGNQLFGVGALDATAYAGPALLIAATALLACWLPARRAARIDPTEALRYE